MKNLIRKFDDLLERYKLKSLKGIAIFCIITIAIHILWRLWAYQLHYAPIAGFMRDSGQFMADIVFQQSSWIVKHVIGMDITIKGNTMYFANDGYLLINSGCSGIKPLMQFIILMMLYPGPWKKKLWFIPLGIIIVHITNLIRVVGLSIGIMEWPLYWKFSHDYIFRPFFYVVIFSMWLWWEERLARSRQYAVGNRQGVEFDID